MLFLCLCDTSKVQEFVIFYFLVMNSFSSIVSLRLISGKKYILYFLETIPNFEVVLQDRALGKFQYCSGDDDYPGAWIFTVVVLQDAFTRDDTNEDCGKVGLLRISFFGTRALRLVLTFNQG